MFQFMGGFFNRSSKGTKQNRLPSKDSTFRPQQPRQPLSESPCNDLSVSSSCQSRGVVGGEGRGAKNHSISNSAKKLNRPGKNKHNRNKHNNQSDDNHNYFNHQSNRDWRKNRGTYSTLQEYSQATLSTGIDQSSVKCPSNIELEEWLALHVTDFVDIITLLFGVIKPYCRGNQVDCRTMNAGEEFQYLWQDPFNNDYLSPTIVDAPTYINLLLIWVSDQLADESIFPSRISQPFPASFLSIVRKIFTRLFRVYGHLYICHIRDIEVSGAIAHLNSSFKHFVYFSNEFDLIPEHELVPLRQLYNAILRK